MDDAHAMTLDHPMHDHIEEEASDLSMILAEETNIWSRLPIELLREVILYLGSTSMRVACELRLVSRHFNVWVLPLLFHAVTFTTPDHVTRFAATLLPKRKVHIPALKSALHTFPRPLSSYAINSLALVVPARVPSVEIGLASVALAFTGVKNLVITAQNLSSNAHWTRQHAIRPQHMMIIHFGFPHLFNYMEPIFESVTHLYTSVLTGVRGTSVVDLPRLTHLAVHTRVDLPGSTAWRVVHEISKTLEALPKLEYLVLVLGQSVVDEPKLENWREPLASCMSDKRFIILPYFRDLHLEWQDIVDGRETLWDRAKVWSAAENEDSGKVKEMSSLGNGQRSNLRTRRINRQEPEWEIDLIQRADYSPYDGDPVERIYTRTRYPKSFVS